MELMKGKHVYTLSPSDVGKIVYTVCVCVFSTFAFILHSCAQHDPKGWWARERLYEGEWECIHSMYPIVDVYKLV